MKKILFLFIILSLIFPPLQPANAAPIHDIVKGRILLQVERNGEAWYVNPQTGTRFFLGRPADAFRVMKEQSDGISNANLEKILFGTYDITDIPDQDDDRLVDILEEALGTNPQSADSDSDGFPDENELYGGFNPLSPIVRLPIDQAFTNANLGRIFLQVESNGEAWYINPPEGRRYFMARPRHALELMRLLGLGITDKDLASIPIDPESADVSDVDSPSINTNTGKSDCVDDFDCFLLALDEGRAATVSGNLDTPVDELNISQSILDKGGFTNRFGADFEISERGLSGERIYKHTVTSYDLKFGGQARQAYLNDGDLVSTHFDAFIGIYTEQNKLDIGSTLTCRSSDQSKFRIAIKNIIAGNFQLEDFDFAECTVTRGSDTNSTSAQAIPELLEQASPLHEKCVTDIECFKSAFRQKQSVSVAIEATEITSQGVAKRRNYLFVAADNLLSGYSLSYTMIGYVISEGPDQSEGSIDSLIDAEFITTQQQAQFITRCPNADDQQTQIFDVMNSMDRNFQFTPDSIQYASCEKTKK